MALVRLRFAVVAAKLWPLRATTRRWTDQSFPASGDETRVSQKFDRVYCFAQGAYLCNHATPKELFAMFLPSVAVPALDVLDPTRNTSRYTGAGQLCTDLRGVLPTLEPLCAACDEAAKFRALDDVLDWANDQCPRDDGLLVWCGAYLALNSNRTSEDAAAVAVGAQPYVQCRGTFLAFVVSKSGKAGAVATSGRW